MHSKLLFLFVPLLLSFSSCRAWRVPHARFDASLTPPAPDYSKPDNWAATPFARDNADTLPLGSGLTDRQESARADVFYIHPTSYNGQLWNAAIDDVKSREKTTSKAILFQASTFNAAGRVFAPFYRQMTYYGFFTKDSASRRRAVELAYSDVRTAFQYYLKHWNEGRPLIIVGHSQGAMLGQMLLKEFFNPQEALYKKLIVAYLPGWPVNETETGAVPPCRTAEDIHCFVSWNTFSDRGHLRAGRFYEKGVCTNPVSWQLEGAYTPLVDHKGALDGKFEKIYPEIISATCENHVLRISTDKLPFPYKYKKVFHVADINLFWMDIRLNAALRSKVFQNLNN